SMDYEIFLVARVAEARRSGLDERAAIVEGLAQTGPVITSAAAVMVVVFAAFTLGDFLVMQILGLALAVGVALDATVVRVAIGRVFTFMSGLYFRGKLAYASAFANPPEGCSGVQVIVPGVGLCPPRATIDLAGLRAIAQVPVDPGDRRYTDPLRRDAACLAER